jgi:hypothetical protein
VRNYKDASTFPVGSPLIFPALALSLTSSMLRIYDRDMLSLIWSAAMDCITRRANQFGYKASENRATLETIMKMTT